MQTRQELFDAQPFHENWNKIVESIEGVEAPLDATASHVQNLARLKKVVTYVEKLKLSVDKDLVPQVVWQNFTTPCQKVWSYISTNEFVPVEQNIDNANGQIDLLLQYLSPFVTIAGDRAEAAGEALEAYSDAINTHTAALKEQTLVSLTEAEKAKKDVQALLGKIDEFKTNLSDFQNELLLDTPDAESTKTKVAALFEGMTETHAQISNYKKELFGTAEDSSGSIVSIVKESKDNTIADRKTAAENLDQMKIKLSELKAVHTDVMGVEDDEGQISGGLKAEYAEVSTKLASYDEEQRTIHAELLRQIEGLLPGATSAGLGTAFETQRKKYDKPIKGFGYIFYGAIGLLFLVGVSTLFTYTKSNGVEFGLPQSFSALLATSLARSAIAIPLVWLAYFAAKRRNENRRLEEEYAHKETIARAYFSFRQQVKELGQEDSGALSAKLLEAAITAVSFNASKSLDKDHADKFPDADQLNKLQDVIQAATKMGTGPAS